MAINNLKISNSNVLENIAINGGTLSKADIEEKPKDNETSENYETFLEYYSAIQLDKYISSINTNKSFNMQHNDEVQGAGPGIEQTADKTFLDLEFGELVGMPLYLSRKVLLKEIDDLEGLLEEEKNEKLQRIFSKILNFQPTEFYFNDRTFGRNEQRFFIDMISTPGLIDNPIVNDFLKNKFSVTKGKKKYNLFLKIINYYETHNQDIVDKFNYILKSCDSITKVLFDHEDIDFDTYFSEKFLSLFGKDDLAFMYRSNYHDMKNFTNPQNEKALFVLSELSKKLNEVSSSNQEYLQTMKIVLENSKWVTLLESYYEWVMVNSRGKSFSEAIDFKDNLGTAELITYMMDNGFKYSFKLCSTDIIEFLEKQDEERKDNHETVLGRGSVEKIYYGVYEESDIPHLSKSDLSYDDLMNFKTAFFKNIYGISLKKAEYIERFYGKHLEEFFKGLPPKSEGMSIQEYLDNLDDSKLSFKKEDYATLQILASICNITKLSLEDENFDEKLRLLQTAYLKQMQEKGILSKSKYVSFPILESALNNLYMNSFSKRLMKVTDSRKIVGLEKDVVLLDAGVEFDMLVTSIGAVSNIYNKNVNMALKWNTASASDCQGLCTSHISSQNMGVFTIEAPILGFDDLDGVSLSMMGTSDIWSYTDTPNLRTKNKAAISENRTFVPGSIMADETRYGYNELLIDRFVNNDNDDNKLQPSYVVYYKFEDNYKKDRRFKEAVKVASDFKVPVMVVDVYKIKDYERQEINKMKEELFSKDSVDKKLIRKIITRYMNNYVGAENFVGYFESRPPYIEDFSCDDMDLFVDDVLQKAKESSNVEESLGWIKALEEAYLDEERKYKESRRVKSESYSVTSFILKNIGVGKRIDSAKEYVDNLFQTEENQIISNTVESVETIDAEKVTVMMPLADMDLSNRIVCEIINEINDSSDFKVGLYDPDGEPAYYIDASSPDALEDKLYNSLIISYLFENNNTIIDDIISNEGKKETNITMKKNYNFVKEIMNSSYKEQLLNGELNEEKLDKIITKLEGKKSFVMSKVYPCLDNKYSFDKALDILDNISDKVDTIRKDFDKLKQTLDSIKNNIDSIGEEGKKF